MALVWSAVISGVSERRLVVCGRKSADGSAELTMESAGWYIRLGNISLYAGTEEPPFKQGDRVILSMRKEPEDENQVERVEGR